MLDIVNLPPDTPARPDGSRVGGWWHRRGRRPDRLRPLPARLLAQGRATRGFCFVRENVGGEMVLTTYGQSTGFCIDPIEKKPLNHFYPGTSVLSFGTAGCNLGCKFCQNWSISKSREVEALSEHASPEQIADRRPSRCAARAWRSPTTIRCSGPSTPSTRPRPAGSGASRPWPSPPATSRPRPAGRSSRSMDAANVDLKGFTEEFYQKYTLSHLQPVLDTLRWLKHESDVWFEVTNLIIPQANDDPGELKRMCDWLLANVGDEVPVHFTAFHPDFRLKDRPPTPHETLIAAREIALACRTEVRLHGQRGGPVAAEHLLPRLRRDGHRAGLARRHGVPAGRGPLRQVRASDRRAVRRGARATGGAGGCRSVSRLGHGTEAASLRTG